MGKELSYDEAKKNVLEALQNFSWEEFYLENIHDFLDSYRAFNAQLRKGDKLELRVSKATYEGKHAEVNHPSLDLILKTSNGKSEKIMNIDGQGFYSYLPNNFLYSDIISYTPEQEEIREPR